MEYKNLYRITPDVLLKLNKNISDVESFKLYEDGNNKQYISELFDSPETNSLDSSVWNFGDYPNTLNKVFNSLRLIDNDDLTVVNNQKIITGSLMLRQGFSWNDVFGILFVVKSMGNQFTKKILLSQIYDINDFKINPDNSKELISGQFWTKYINFCIPNLGENLMVSVEIVNFSDVEAGSTNLGEIYNYPTNDSSYEPLVNEELIPDFIQTDVDIQNNLFLKIQPKTLELNKTLEQSILDYFSLSNNVVTIDISHVVKYGTETSGYKTIRISNEDNKFGFVKFGLDLTEFDSTQVIVFVSSEIVCNNKLMIRNQQLIFDYMDILNPAIANIIQNPETVYPVQITNVQEINNTVIETKTETKILPIFQTIFAEIVTENVKFENKKIIFENIKKPCYFTIPKTEEFILSKVTAEDKYYFDLSELIEPENDIEYNILDASDKSLIQKGLLIIEK